MDSPEVHNRKSRQWTRARGKISAQGGVQAHMNALAYVSDSYFIGTISRIHKLWRFPVKVDEIDTLDPWVVQQIKDLQYVHYTPFSPFASMWDSFRETSYGGHFTDNVLLIKVSLTVVVI